MEAFFLQSAVEEMLPKEAESVYGSGFAGDVWKSMLAEQIAAEIAKSTKFGIAEMLAGKHFASAPGRGAPTTSSVSGKTEAAPGSNQPFLDNAKSPAMPLENVLTGGAAAPKRS
jgi:Rod binding domain-containing protein